MTDIITPKAETFHTARCGCCGRTIDRTKWDKWKWEQYTKEMLVNLMTELVDAKVLSDEACCRVYEKTDRFLDSFPDFNER